MTQKPRIALVYDAIFPYIKGGAEKRFFEIGRELAKKGYEVHLYGMKFWDGPKDIKKDGMHLHGICKAWPLYDKKGKRSSFGAFMFSLSCFKLVREDFEYIDCCSIPFLPLFVCRIVATLKRKRLYSTWHEIWGKSYWTGYLGRTGLVGYYIERLAVKLPDEFIVVSHHTADRLARIYKSRKPVHIVENGISVDKVNEVRPSKQTSDLIYVGRLANNKNINVLLRAVKLLKKARPSVQLLVVGDGPERPTLEKLSASLGLQRNVTFTGFVEKDADVIAVMKASKVFVLPSSREGFGIVAIEANAAGLPVVTVNVSTNAAASLITEKNGVVTKLSPASLSKSCDVLLSRRPSRATCKAVARQYDWSIMADKLKAVMV